jgi:hypothetical protein
MTLLFGFEVGYAEPNEEAVFAIPIAQTAPPLGDVWQTYRRWVRQARSQLPGIWGKENAVVFVALDNDFETLLPSVENRLSHIQIGAFERFTLEDGVVAQLDAEEHLPVGLESSINLDRQIGV